MYTRAEERHIKSFLIAFKKMLSIHNSCEENDRV